MGFQIFCGKGPHQLLWAGLRTSSEKITVRVTRNYITYCEMFVEYTEFTNVAVVLVSQEGEVDNLVLLFKTPHLLTFRSTFISLIKEIFTEETMCV